MDQAAKAKVLSTLADFQRQTGKSCEDGLREVAGSVGKQLATKVYPFGLSANIGERMQGSIDKQVRRAIRHGNVTGQGGNAASVHLQNRNRRGRVPKDISTDGRFKRSPIGIGETIAQSELKKKLAGQGKGAWIQAANSAKKGNLTGVAAWEARHWNKGNGASSESGKGLDVKIQMENNVQYISSIQAPKSIAQALAAGLKNGYKALQKTIDKSIEKANRQLSK